MKGSETILPRCGARIKQCYQRGEIHVAVESAELLPINFGDPHLVNIRAKRAILAGLLAMVAIHVMLFWSLREQVSEGYSDFASFYGAGRILHGGLHDKVYDYQTQWDLQRSFAPKVVIRHGPLLYNHSPFEAWLFALFGGLPYPVAFVLWDGLNLGMLAGVAWLMRTYVPGGFGFVLLVGLALFPVFLAFVQGQDSVLLLALFVLAFRSLKSGREFAAGIWLGLGLFKPHLVLPLALIFLFRAQIKVLAGFAISAIAVFIASVAAVGRHDTLNYPRYVWKLTQQHAIGAITPVNMPNVRGLLDSLFAGYRLVVPVVSVAVAVFLTYLAARIWNRLSDNSKIPSALAIDLGFSFAVIATVLVSYHLYAYDASLVLLPIIVMSGLVLSDGRRSRPTTICIALLLFTPLWAGLLFWARHLNLIALVIGFFGWTILQTSSELTSRGVPRAPTEQAIRMGASADNGK